MHSSDNGAIVEPDGTFSRQRQSGIEKPSCQPRDGRVKRIIGSLVNSSSHRASLGGIVLTIGIRRVSQHMGWLPFDVRLSALGIRIM